MRHEEAHRRLPAAVLARLELAPDDPLREHLQHCPVCREEAGQMRRVLDRLLQCPAAEIDPAQAEEAAAEVLATIERQRLSPDRTPRMAARPRLLVWVVAAGVLILVVCGLWGWRQRAGRPTGPLPTGDLVADTEPVHAPTAAPPDAAVTPSAAPPVSAEAGDPGEHAQTLIPALPTDLHAVVTDSRDGRVLEELWWQAPGRIRWVDPNGRVTVDDTITCLVLDPDGRQTRLKAGPGPDAAAAATWLWDLALRFHRPDEPVSPSADPNRAGGALLPRRLDTIDRSPLIGPVTAWIDPANHLTVRVEAARADPRRPGTPQPVTVTFDYDTIDPGRFDTRTLGGQEPAQVTEVRLSGQVIDDRDRPVPGAAVTCRWADGSTALLETRTDAEGRFALAWPAGGAAPALPVLVWADAGPAEARRGGWVLLADEAEPQYRDLVARMPGAAGTVVTQPDRGGVTRLTRAEELVLVTQPTDPLSVGVVDEAGEPVTGAELQVYVDPLSDAEEALDLPWVFWQEQGTSDDAGQVTVSMPVCGPRLCRLRLSVPGRVSQTRRIREAGPVDLTWTLWPEVVTVRGRLLDAEGRPLADQWVWPEIGSTRYQRRARTDTAGTFVLDGCPDHPDLEIVTERPVQWRGGRRTWIGFEVLRTAVSLTDEGQGHVDVTVPGAGPPIHVEVVDGNGTAVAGVPVELQGQWIEQDLTVRLRQWRQRTDDRGRCVFAGVPQLPELVVVVDPAVPCQPYTGPAETVDLDRRRALVGAGRVEVPLETAAGFEQPVVVVLPERVP